MCSSSDMKTASASAWGRDQHSKSGIWAGFQDLQMLHAPKPSNQDVQFNGHFVGDSWGDKAELCVTLEDPVNGPTDLVKQQKLWLKGQTELSAGNRRGS